MSNQTTTSNENMSELIGATSSTSTPTGDDGLLHSAILNPTGTSALNMSTNTSSPAIRSALGYCHVCNKQNRINLDSFTCVQCNGGFIEIFDLSDTNEQRSGDIFNLNANETNNQTNRLANDNSSIHHSTTSNPASNSNFIFINGSSSRTNQSPDTSSSLNAPLLQLIRRLNRSSRSTPSNENTDTTSNTTTTSTQSGLSSTEQAGNHSSQRVEPIRFGSSIHYRLRRHANSNNSNSTHNTNTGSNSSSSSSSSSVYSSPSMSSRHHHRHRYHRSPTSRLHFNFIDDEELIHDHGAIIITTLINQLRNTNRGAAPASETQIDSLPLVDIDQMLVEKITQCAICMEEFILNETAKQLPCKHLYHNPCIVQWLKLHATCPVCRTNINGTNQSELESNNERTNLFNIFPISASSSLISAATVAAATNQLNESNTNNSNDSHLHHQHYQPQQQQQQQSRRSMIRNPHVYRIQIRQSLNPSAPSSTTNSAANTTDNEYSLRPLRSRRVTSPSSAASSSTANGSAVNTVPCSVVVPRLSPSAILNATTSQNTSRSDETRSSAFSSLNERNETPSSTSNNNANINNGSRVAHLMDRLFRYNRLTNRSSAISNQNRDTSSSNTSSINSNNVNNNSNNGNSTNNNSSSPFRFAQLFRSRQHPRRNSSTIDTTTSSSSAAATTANPQSDFFEMFRVESFNDSRFRNRSNRPSNSNADNRSSLFSFDLLNSSNSSNNDETARLESNLLGDLFDIPEHNIPLLRRSTRERRSRNASNNQESITITIDEDDSSNSNMTMNDSATTNITNSNMNVSSNNNHSLNSNNANMIATLLDSDDAIESSSYETSSNETNLIGTIDLVSEENSSNSSHSITSATSSSSSSSSSSDSSSSDSSTSSNLPHVAKKRKTEST